MSALEKVSPPQTPLVVNTVRQEWVTQETHTLHALGAILLTTRGAPENENSFEYMNNERVTI